LLFEWRPVGETVVEAIAAVLEQIVGWLGGGLATRPVAAALGRADRWPHFFAAYNWTLAVTTAAMTLVAATLLLPLAGTAAPVPIGFVLGHAVVVVALACYLLRFHWFVARTALQVGGMKAVVVVVAELGVAAGLPWLLHRIADA
jgi:hypothetical protein